MPNYKLTYFNGRGFGDVSRQLFVLAGVPFEDERLEDADWTEEKKCEMPFRQMPVLTIDGTLKIPQSLAIARYLARKFGYAGKTPEEEAIVDALGDQFKDFYNATWTYYHTKIGFLENDIQKETEMFIPHRDKFLGFLTDFLKRSKSGFLVDGGLTYADLIISDDMRTHLIWMPEYAEKYPEVMKWYQKVDSIPAIRKHIENSPVTRF